MIRTPSASIDTYELALARGSLADLELAGVAIEVRDVAAARSFYGGLFEEGAWRESASGVTYEAKGQRVDLVQRSRPRSLGPGQHQAYRVPAAAIQAVEGVEWWREDHPRERQPSAYALDPSGNRVQLLEGSGGLIDHVAVEVHDMELAEIFYCKSLGGSADYWHGWAMDDYAEAYQWADGADPCAPWTRRYDVRYWDKLRVPRPNMQLFVRFGEHRLGLILATEHRQEPPLEMLEGAPRIILRSPSSVQPHLEALGIPFASRGDSVFLRDPSGNHVEIELTAR